VVFPSWRFSVSFVSHKGGFGWAFVEDSGWVWANALGLLRERAEPPSLGRFYCP